uniref:Uncharacterized protein n=1 Tax=Octopus bimaculoides TaxID=37653 RepID=A0A0L8FZZ9_OCTBM
MPLFSHSVFNLTLFVLKRLPCSKIREGNTIQGLQVRTQQTFGRFNPMKIQF